MTSYDVARNPFISPRRSVAQPLLAGLLISLTSNGLAESVSDHAVLVNASTQTNPPVVNLFWPPDSAATNYMVYRKGRDATSWGAPITLPGTALGYTDSNVVIAGTYDYAVAKNAASY